jgi:hypothetical protein
LLPVEALFRIQLYHDSQNSIRLQHCSHRARVSCPQLSKQRAMVHEVLALTNRYYEGVTFHTHSEGAVRSVEHSIPVREQRRMHTSYQYRCVRCAGKRQACSRRTHYANTGDYTCKSSGEHRTAKGSKHCTRTQRCVELCYSPVLAGRTERGEGGGHQQHGAHERKRRGKAAASSRSQLSCESYPRWIAAQQC